MCYLCVSFHIYIYAFLQDFPAAHNLKKLIACDNRIDNLRGLSKYSQLRVLDLRGNPVCFIEDYRSRYNCCIDAYHSFALITKNIFEIIVALDNR